MQLMVLLLTIYEIDGLIYDDPFNWNNLTQYMVGDKTILVAQKVSVRKFS